jgi:hypothetical protein
VLELRVAQDPATIRPPATRANEAAQRRDLHLVEQVPEEGRLGQDLQVQERRRRLEWDRR